ncbi:universal stress protein [Actinomadura rudentiformis]|nr:universal stress protein [Actinomadura rudentiformis]
MKGTILVGVDGSEPSDAALDWALREAARRGAPLRLIHAGTGPPSEASLNPQESSDVSEAQRVLDNARARAREGVPEGSDVAGDLVTGSAAAALIERAGDASLVVVGNRGLGGFKGLLLGSVAHQVAGHAPCPVALVPAGPPAADDAEIVVGVGDGPAEPQIDLGVREAALRGAPVRLLRAWALPTAARPGDMVPMVSHIGEIQERQEARLNAMLTACREDHPELTVSAQVVNASARDTLIEASARAGLIVVGTHDDQRRHLMALGSVTSALIHHATCPVLIARTIAS